MNLINFNGEILPADSHFISADNRAFRYGDGLFESMRCNEHGINFIDLHVKRLLSGLAALKMTIPQHFDVGFVSDQINKLYKAKQLRCDTRIRFIVFRNEGGYYVPETNEFSFIIQIEPLADAGYKLNEKGLNIGIFDEILKPVNPLSNYKTANALIFVMAGIYKNENKFDDCLIKNEKGEIIEAISSNVFLVKDGILVTPHLNSGCVAGVMREVLIQIARQNGIEIKEQNLLPFDLESADELFLTNAGSGIKWVSQLGRHNYDNKTTLLLSQKLEEYIEFSC